MKNIDVQIAEIVSHVDGKLWFDMEFGVAEGNRLKLVGAEDLTYYHEIEIYFEGVRFMLVGDCLTWSPPKPWIEVIDMSGIGANLPAEMIWDFYEKGTTLFRINGDDYAFFVIAEGISYKKEIVKHYDENGKFIQKNK